MVTFRARLEPVHNGGHSIVISDELAAEAGVKFRDRVRGTLNGTPYRSSLARYSGRFHVGIHVAVLEAARVAAPAMVKVTLEPDPEPLPGDLIPDDLSAALARNQAAAAAWARLAPSHRREHVNHINDAKKPETRARRVAATLAALKK